MTCIIVYYTHMHTCTHRHSHKDTHAHTQAHTQTHTHTHAHTCCLLKCDCLYVSLETGASRPCRTKVGSSRQQSFNWSTQWHLMCAHTMSRIMATHTIKEPQCCKLWCCAVLGGRSRWSHCSVASKVGGSLVASYPWDLRSWTLEGQYLPTEWCRW